jgi:hypothetical protein
MIDPCVIKEIKEALKQPYPGIVGHLSKKYGIAKWRILLMRLKASTNLKNIAIDIIMKRILNKKK